MSTSRVQGDGHSTVKETGKGLVLKELNPKVEISDKNINQIKYDYRVVSI